MFVETRRIRNCQTYGHRTNICLFWGYFPEAVSKGLGARFVEDFGVIIGQLFSCFLEDLFAQEPVVLRCTVAVEFLAYLLKDD